MTAQRTITERAARAGSFIAVPIIPILGVLGLVVGIAAFVSVGVTGEIADYWPLVGAIWLTLLFGLAIASILANYWLPRLVSRGREVLPGMFVVFYAGGIPAVAWVITLAEFSVPLWLLVLGMASIVLGLGSFLDALVIRPLLMKRKNTSR